MFRFLTGILLLTAFVSQAAIVRVEGISALPGYPVRVLAPDDLISGRQKEIAASGSDFKGSFMLDFDLPAPGWVTIAAAHYKTEMFVSPGGKYRVQLELRKAEAASFYDPQPLSVKLLSADDGGLAEAIAAANVAYNAFVVEHFNALYRLQQGRLIDSLRTVMRRLSPKQANPFFDDYVFYKVASVEQVVRKIGPAQVYERYFAKKPVLSSQPEYVALLNETFKNHLIQNRLWSNQEYVEAAAKGWKAFDDLIRRDPLLAARTEFRELVVLVHFVNNFNNPLHTGRSAEKILSELASATSTPQHARIAKNIVFMAKWLATGTDAPQFRLQTEGGRELVADQGSPAMLLILVGPECKYCEFELQQLRELHQRLGNQYKFITISLPESFQHYRNFHRRNKLDWEVYNLGHNYSLLDALDVRVFPHLSVYLPGAKVGMIPAPTTDQRLEGHLQRLARQFVNP
ncbi:MAG: redoxin domain-containing protein [Bacteroidetes bacterium]|nr:redoxin domain-containing protein [Bacteroidota bacterium]